MEEERWCKNDRHPGYEISDKGYIRAVTKGGVISRGPKYRYDQMRNILTVNMHDNMGNQEKVSLPRLVAETFHGGPHDDREAIQLDGDIYNPNADNIAWSDECIDNPNAMYSPVNKIRNKETGKIYDSVYECAEDLGDKVNSIKRCVGNPKYITRTRNHLEIVRTDEVKRNV